MRPADLHRPLALATLTIGGAISSLAGIAMRRLLIPLFILGLATSLSGCVVGGPGWCYYHPHRC
jgi:hypothetical protein